MTDRELLEAAARAAGIVWSTTLHIEKKGLWIGEFYSGKEWNPLTDDGDALRLAIRLCLHVTPGGGNTDVCRINSQEWVSEPHSRTDPYTATRRAIVRAAAAIGAHKEGD